MGERGRPWWLVLAAAVPVGLPLLGQWQAALTFAGLVGGVAGPLYLAQWWGRHRQRAAHAAGAETWVGHLPLHRAVGVWRIGVGTALLFGGGVPVRLTARPGGLTFSIRGGVAGRRNVPVTVEWSDIAAVRTRPAGRATEWGRVALLPLTAVTFDLVGGADDALVVTTHDAGGLVEVVAGRKL